MIYSSKPFSRLHKDDDLAADAAGTTSQMDRTLHAGPPFRRFPYYISGSVLLAVICVVSAYGQSAPAADQGIDRAEAILQKAVENLGGDRYLKVTSQVSRGRYSIMKEGTVVSFQSFIDVIAFPDKERTDFKSSGIKSVQANVGDSGWTFDGDAELIKIQGAKQIESFKLGIRTSLDNLLRGQWRRDGKLSYVGRRQATLGKRNEVVKLTYNDGLAVEFEFTADDGLPVKASYTRNTEDGEATKEEDRYAQFVDVSGIKAPFIIDRFTNGQHASRINYESIEYNKRIPDSIFAKPSNPKDLKKDLQF